MSLIENSTLKVIKNQFLFKLKTNYLFMFSLVLCQIAGILLSIFSGSGTTSGDFKVTSYSLNYVIAFSIISIFTFSFLFGTSKYKSLDFSFVSNRFSSNVSNIFILLFYSVIAGITTTLCGSLLRFIVYCISGGEFIKYDNFFMEPSYLLLNLLSITLISIFISSIGYFFGSLEQIHKMLIGIFPLLAIVLLISSNNDNPYRKFFIDVFSFFFSEHSIPVYSLKLLIASAMLFLVSTLITARLEVRK